MVQGKRITAKLGAGIYFHLPPGISGLPQQLTFSSVVGRSQTGQKATFPALFDHLVGTGEKSGWNSNAEGLGGIQVDN
jgi:hypothetical protein